MSTRFVFNRPRRRQSLGADHYLTLGLGQNLATALSSNPERARDDLRFYINGAASRPLRLDTGGGVLEAETIVQDVVRRRRRVFGPARPSTLSAERVAERVLSLTTPLARADAA